MTLDQIYHSLDPVALSLGPISIRWYGIAYLLGFILGGVVLWRTARRWKLGLTPDDVSTLIVGIAFGVIVGGRLGYCLFYGDGWYLAHPIDIVMINEGGMSFHGGLAGAIIGGAIVCRQLGLSFRTMCDLGVIAAPLGLFFGRCANFVNGCGASPATCRGPSPSRRVAPSRVIPRSCTRPFWRAWSSSASCRLSRAARRPRHKAPSWACSCSCTACSAS